MICQILIEIKGNSNIRLKHMKFFKYIRIFLILLILSVCCPSGFSQSKNIQRSKTTSNANSRSQNSVSKKSNSSSKNSRNRNHQEEKVKQPINIFTENPDLGFQVIEGPEPQCKLDYVTIYKTEKIEIPGYVTHNSITYKVVEIAPTVHPYAEEIIIPNTVVKIDDSAFSGCETLKKVVIPNSVKYIGNKAFEGCCALKDVTMSNSVEYIGENAFRTCYSLHEIEIPSFTKVADNAFSNSLSLKIIRK